MNGQPAVLRKAELHGSLTDPLLDTMNFLNEITSRYPSAISFASRSNPRLTPKEAFAASVPAID